MRTVSCRNYHSSRHAGASRAAAKRQAPLLAAASLLLALSADLVSANEPVRILPMGDSITAGYLDPGDWDTQRFEFGYRSGLYTRLSDAGYDFQFVGGSQEPWNNAYGDPTLGGTYTPELDLRDFGQDGHRGYGGWRAGNFLANNNIQNYLAADNPDIILLMVGTNSYTRPNASNPDFDKDNLNTLVNAIFVAKPDAQLVVAEIMPRANVSPQNQTPYDNVHLRAYNTYIRETLVPTYQNLGKSISSVDQYSIFLSDPNNPDSVDTSLFSNGINHPSKAGYDLMAQTWFDELESLLGPPPATTIQISTAIHGPFNPSNTTDEVFYAADVSGVDLLHGLAGVHSGWRNSNGAMDVYLNDGDAGGDFNDEGLFALVGAAWANAGDNVSTSEYELGAGSEGLGYDITEIQSIAAWQGAGFANQKYDVSVRYVGETEFTPLVRIDYQPLSADLISGASTKVNVTDESGVLASGVEAIRFSILDVNSAPTAGTVYREIDVFGAATRLLLPGDFNDDGTVDAADYTVWRDNLGADESVLPAGSGDGSGTVDTGDYMRWKQNFGAPAALGAREVEGGNVPEPDALLLLGAGGLVIGARKRLRL